MQQSHLKPFEVQDKEVAKIKMLKDFDLGDDTVEVILQNDYYTKVLSDVNCNHLVNTSQKKVKMDTFLSQIGALFRYESSSLDTRVIRFDILRAAWQVHGYEFSNLKRMKRLKGINFNMLNNKSIRIMNRFAKKVSQF